MSKQQESVVEQLGLDKLRDEVQDFGRALTHKGLQKITSMADVSGAASAVKDTVKDGVKDTVKGGIKDKVKGVVPGMSSGSGSSKDKGKGNNVKVTTIIESVDVPVPRTIAYQQWTQFQEFPNYMKKVENVEQQSDEKLKWQAQIFWSHRTWEATITEQVPDERIVWKSQGEKGHVDGAVTFHELAPDLTRVLAVLEYHPKGLFEKTGNIWRAQGRRARVELKQFQRHVSTQTLLHQDEVDGWTGEIHDAKVTKEDGATSRSGTRRPAKKSAAAKRAPAKKSTSSSSSAAKRAPAKRAAAKKAPAKKAPAKKTTAAKKAPAKKAPAKKTTAAKKAPAKKTTAARKAPAKKTTSSRTRRTPAKKSSSSRS